MMQEILVALTRNAIEITNSKLGRRNNMKIQKGKQLDFTIEDVNNVYSGPVGVLWEMLMGEQIHVGGEKEKHCCS
jgi:hypothetical protein